MLAPASVPVRGVARGVRQRQRAEEAARGRRRGHRLGARRRLELEEETRARGQVDRAGDEGLETRAMQRRVDRTAPQRPLAATNTAAV